MTREKIAFVSSITQKSKTPDIGNLENPEEAKTKKANKPKTTGEKECLGVTTIFRGMKKDKIHKKGGRKLFHK